MERFLTNKKLFIGEKQHGLIDKYEIAIVCKIDDDDKPNALQKVQTQ